MLFYTKNPLVLPSYDTVKDEEGKGNWAVNKYYKWPYSFFYRKKLNLILGLIGNDYYHNILDFGAGPGIFRPALKKKALFVVSCNTVDEINDRWKFDAVVCASVLEFCDLEQVLPILKNCLKVSRGKLYVASPLKNRLTNLYFKLINDNTKRNSHTEIKDAISKHFKIYAYRTWMNLYFALKASAR